jgi:hypothetical protein
MPLPLYSQGKSPGTHWRGGWVGPRTGLDAVVRGKVPSPETDIFITDVILNFIASHHITSLLHVFWFTDQLFCIKGQSIRNITRRVTFPNVAIK